MLTVLIFFRYEAEITLLHQNEYFGGDEELALKRYHGFMAISLLVETKAHAWNEGFQVRQMSRHTFPFLIIIFYHSPFWKLLRLWRYLGLAILLQILPLI